MKLTTNTGHKDMAHIGVVQVGKSIDLFGCIMDQDEGY